MRLLDVLTISLQRVFGVTWWNVETNILPVPVYIQKPLCGQMNPTLCSTHIVKKKKKEKVLHFFCPTDNPENIFKSSLYFSISIYCT